jgi:hypothetical protein
MNNYVLDDEDIFLASENIPLNPHVPAVETKPDRRLEKTVPFVDEAYDLCDATTQRSIFTNPDADSGFSCTFDVMRTVRRNTMDDPRVTYIHLSATCGHFSSDSEDHGFSCGYRNAQVLISAMFNFPALRRRLVEELGGMYVPSIAKLQALIERGWRDGWDPIGFQEHKGKLVGTVGKFFHNENFFS